MKSCRRPFRGILVGVCFAWATLSLGAQERIGGELVYAEGRDFSVVHNGIRTVYEVSSPDSLGLPLQEGDLVQTGSKSFVEIQLFPRGSMLKLAENSSLLIRKIGIEQQEVSLDLVYGRVRAKVARLAGSESFSIRALGAIAGVRGTDFGLDAIIKQSDSNNPSNAAMPLLQAYCFSGELSVQPLPSNPSKNETLNSVQVKANEMLTVDKSASISLIEKKSIEPSIVVFWNLNEFKGPTPQPAPESTPLLTSTKTTSSISDGEIRYIEPDYSLYKKTVNDKNFGILMASFFTLVGAGFGAAGAYSLADGNSQGGMYPLSIGVVSLGAGFATLIASYLVNTVSP